MNHTDTSSTIDIAVIGGGAAGMAAAWFSRRGTVPESTFPVRTALFERNDRLGKKLLSTGNGRCNLTNLDSHTNRFHGSDPEFVQEAFTRFPPSEVIARFEELGVTCTVEENSKVFPASLHASSVLDALRLALDENNIALFTGIKIVAVGKQGNLFSLAASDGKTYRSRAIIVATGGMSAPATGSDGNGYKLLAPFSHHRVATAPSIVQLTTDTSFVKPLAGHKIQGTVTLTLGTENIRTEQGEILFTDYGLSGPPVLQLSGYVARALRDVQPSRPVAPMVITIDFLPGYTFDETFALLRKRKNTFSGRTLEEYLTGFFQRRLAYGLLKHALRKPLSTPVARLTDQEITLLARTCKELPITVTGTRSFTHAQATSGGIATTDFNPATMESLKCPGLFVCGELLDIDGDCGGFNLQWAWASGFMAGSGAVDYLQRHR
jgi:predicted Rossmann fold flavoprotein